MTAWTASPDRDGRASAASGGDDCDDGDAATRPGAPELCGDTRDNDCVGGDVACVGTGWAGAGIMYFARRQHTSTVLVSGKVLIVGDAPVTRTPQVGFADIYDPAVGAFGLSDVMAQAREGHAMVQLQDGRVMVVGGKVPGPSGTRSVEIYDPTTNRWTAGAALNCQASIPDCSNPASPFVGRYLHTATLLNNGSVLVVGGYNNGVFTTSELWNPATNTWTPAADLNAGRTRHTATRLSDGRVLIAGGWDESSSQRVAPVEIYGPLMNTFTTVAPLPVPVQDAAAVRLMDGRVVLFGGTEANGATGFGRASSAVQIYDPTSNTWTASQNLARPEANPQATLLNDGTVLVTGSDTSVSLWIPSQGPNGAFVQQRPMGLARKFHNAIRLTSGHVLVTGGMDAGSGASLDSAERLDTP